MEELETAKIELAGTVKPFSCVSELNVFTARRIYRSLFPGSTARRRSARGFQCLRRVLVRPDNRPRRERHSHKTQRLKVLMRFPVFQTPEPKCISRPAIVFQVFFKAGFFGQRLVMDRRDGFGRLGRMCRRE